MRDHARRGDREADQRGGILEQDDEARGVLRPADRLPPAEIALRSGEFADRDDPRRALHQRSDRQHDIIDERIGQFLRGQDMAISFVDRHSCADREDQDGDDERPEIQFASIAERVRVVGRLRGALLAVQEQDLVAAIDAGVESLGQHRRRSGQSRRDEFRDADAKIGGERGIEDYIGLLIGRIGHERSLSVPCSSPCQQGPGLISSGNML